MSERDDLLASVASIIMTYRTGELAAPTSQHVDRWLSQFTPDQQLPFLREFDHVMKHCFLTLEYTKGFLKNLVKNEKLAGNNPASYWASTNFLSIQQKGQSQKEMLRLFGDCLGDSFGLDISKCGQAGGDYVYLDDIMFSGNRVGNDLEHWIANSAPASARIHVIVIVLHSGGSYLVQKRLKDAIQASGKTIHISYWRASEVENRKWHKNSSAVLWPTAIPNTPEVQSYISLPTKYPFEPRQASTTSIVPFSSEAARQILESEFLIAGAKILSKIENPKPSLRPLGFSPFGVGFGSLVVTYRNCPNNCPLALWWGDPEQHTGALNWYPLVQRDGYSSARNIFSEFGAL